MTSVVAPTALTGKPFRIFWTGQSVSFFGTEITILALPLVAVLMLDASPAQMGAVVAAETLPCLLGPLVLGGVVDRFDRRVLLLVADYARFLSLVTLPLATLAGLLSMPLVLAVAFSVGLFSVLADVAFFALVPHFVQSADLVAANSRLETSRATARIAGPPAGGALTQVAGAANALLVDAGTYLFSIVQLHRLRGLVDARDEAPERHPWYAGFREVAARAPLRLLAFGSGMFNFFSAGGFAIVALYVVSEVGLSPGLYGLSLAFGGVGGLVGAALAPRVAGRLGPRRSLATGLLFCGIAEAVVVLVHEPGPTAVVLLSTSRLIETAAVMVYIVVNAGLRQRIIAPALRGRTYAAMRLTNQGLMPVGALAFGSLATAIGMRPTILVIAVGQLSVAAAFAAFSHVLPKEID